jgi:hypothetical protein
VLPLKSLQVLALRTCAADSTWCVMVEAHCCGTAKPERMSGIHDSRKGAPARSRSPPTTATLLPAHVQEAVLEAATVLQPGKGKRRPSDWDRCSADCAAVLWAVVEEAGAGRVFVLHGTTGRRLALLLTPEMGVVLCSLLSGISAPADGLKSCVPLLGDSVSCFVLASGSDSGPPNPGRKEMAAASMRGEEGYDSQHDIFESDEEPSECSSAI